MCVTGERTLFSIKTKSGALHDDFTAHTDSELILNATKNALFRIFFTRLLTRLKFVLKTGVQIPHLSAFRSEKEVLLRPGMSAVSNFKHFDLFHQDRLRTAASSALTHVYFCTMQGFASASQVRSI